VPPTWARDPEEEIDRRDDEPNSDERAGGSARGGNAGEPRDAETHAPQNKACDNEDCGAHAI
jgi:hypothetical protein